MQINELDRIDYRILDRLQKDGRASNAELSEIAHLSPPQCFRRVKRLEEAGMIDRYVAILSPGALGFGVTAFVSVTLGGGRRVDPAKVQGNRGRRAGNPRMSRRHRRGRLPAQSGGVRPARILSFSA